MVVPTSFGRPPIVPRAIDIGGPGWPSEIVSVKARLRETGLARYMLKRSGKFSVGCEVKIEILVETFY